MSIGLNRQNPVNDDDLSSRSGKGYLFSCRGTGRLSQEKAACFAFPFMCELGLFVVVCRWHLFSFRKVPDLVSDCPHSCHALKLAATRPRFPRLPSTTSLTVNTDPSIHCLPSLSTVYFSTPPNMRFLLLHFYAQGRFTLLLSSVQPINPIMSSLHSANGNEVVFSASLDGDQHVGKIDIPRY